MLKIKKVWEEYKVPIIIVGGICATVVGYKTYGLWEVKETFMMGDKRAETKELKLSKKDSIKIASQLCYSNKVIFLIQNAKTTEEVYRIMLMARRGEI